MLDVSHDLVAVHVASRAAQGNHFMWPLLLLPQLDLLRICDVKGIFKVDPALSPQQIVMEIEDWLGSTTGYN